MTGGRSDILGSMPMSSSSSPAACARDAGIVACSPKGARVSGASPCRGRAGQDRVLRSGARPVLAPGAFGCAAPVPHLLVSPRTPQGPPAPASMCRWIAALLAAGDHNGSTFYQHQRFLQVIRENGPVEVNLSDGAWAVAVGLAAQESIATGRTVDVTPPLQRITNGFDIGLSEMLIHVVLVRV